MEKKLSILIVILIMGNFELFAKDLSPNRKPIALTIMFDTSWTCEHCISDFVTLSRQAISSCLMSGDYLEVISAHTGEPKIRLAQRIKAGSPQEIKSITTILSNVRSVFFSNANNASIS